MALEDDRLGLSKEVIACKALPFLFPLSIENGLTVKQYSVVMALIRNMTDRVEQEHSAKLAQLNSIQVKLGENYLFNRVINRLSKNLRCN